MHYPLKRRIPPFIRTILAVCALLAGASFCFLSDKFHSQASYFYINKLPIPWFAYGLILIAASGLLLNKSTKPIGYLIGGIVYSLFALCLWLAFLGGLHADIPLLGALVQDFPKTKVGNAFSAINSTTIAAIYWFAMKEAITRHADPEFYKLAHKCDEKGE